MKLKNIKKEKRILKNFKLKESTVKKLIILAKENETSMTNIVEYLINEKVS